MLARIPLAQVVLLTLLISLVSSVLVLLGAPMAGGWSAVAAAIIAGVMTILMALAFSHGEHPDAGH